MRVVHGALVDFPLAVGAHPCVVIDEADGAGQDEAGVFAAHGIGSDADGFCVASRPDGTSPSLEDAAVRHGESQGGGLDVAGTRLPPEAEKTLGRRREGDAGRAGPAGNVRDGNTGVAARAGCLSFASQPQSTLVFLHRPEGNAVGRQRGGINLEGAFAGGAVYPGEFRSFRLLLFIFWHAGWLILLVGWETAAFLLHEGYYLKPRLIDEGSHASPCETGAGLDRSLLLGSVFSLDTDLLSEDTRQRREMPTTSAILTKEPLATMQSPLRRMEMTKRKRVATDMESTGATTYGEPFRTEFRRPCCTTNHAKQ